MGAREDPVGNIPRRSGAIALMGLFQSYPFCRDFVKLNEADKERFQDGDMSANLTLPAPRRELLEDVARHVVEYVDREGSLLDIGLLPGNTFSSSTQNFQRGVRLFVSFPVLRQWIFFYNMNVISSEMSRVLSRWS